MASSEAYAFELHFQKMKAEKILTTHNAIKEQFIHVGFRKMDGRGQRSPGLCVSVCLVYSPGFGDGGDGEREGDGRGLGCPQPSPHTRV